MQAETPLERARRLAGAVAQPFLLVDYALRFDQLVRRSPPSGVRVRAGGAADAALLRQLPGGEEAAVRLAAGHTVLLAEVAAATLAGCLWYACGRVRVPGFGFPVEPPPGECYSYGLRVAREARRQGVATALFAALAADARLRGVHGLAGFVSLHNRAAVRVQHAIGARPRRLLVGLTVRRRHALVLGCWLLGRSVVGPLGGGRSIPTG